ncbi:MAG: hypothetical protein WC415_02910 [Patescibacteria group bacterium]|jgi:hypothetical protein
MSEKIRKNIHIEVLKYAHEKSEFICTKLSKDLNFNQNEKQLFFGKLIHDKTLLQNLDKNQKTDRGEETMFTISTEGRFKLLEFEQLENASQTSMVAINKANLSIYIALVAVFLNILALWVAIVSLNKTQQSLELSAIPELSITAIDNGLEKDKIKEPGHYQISDSKANFILKNNFLGEVKDLDIKMIVLEMHIDQKSKHPVFCPFAYVNYTNNPSYKVDEHWQTYSILENKLYSFESLDEKKFSIDYKNLNKALQYASSSDFFIKIDVNYKRAIDGKSFLFTKIYKIFNLFTVSGDNKGLKIEYLVDTDIDKQIMIINDLNNEVVKENDYKYPIFAVYPFNENTFVNDIKSRFLPPYSLQPSKCEYFELNAKNKIIE